MKYKNKQRQVIIGFVQIAHKVGDPNIPRPWSRYSAKKESLHNGESKNAGAGSGLKGSKDTGATKDKAKKKQNSEDANPQLEEFLQLMQPRIKSKLWANDTIEAPAGTESSEGNVRQARERNGSKGEIGATDLSSPTHDSSIEVPANKDAVELARDELLSDADYFKSKVKKNWSDSEDDGEDSSSGHEDEHESTEVDKGEGCEKVEETSHEDLETEIRHDVNDAVDKDARHQQVLETGRLFVRNLPYTATYDDFYVYIYFRCEDDI